MRVGPSRDNWREHANAGQQIFSTLNVTDTDGNPIQAHGGGIIQEAGYFYWFGEDKTGQAANGLFQGVNCYRSKDLAIWEYQGAVLTALPNTNISSDHIVERPKVLYNKKNQEYVMWFHNDDAAYGVAMVGIATSKTIAGKYTWQGSFKPLGTDSRDFTVWQDPDDASLAYLIFASDNNADFKIALLDSDFRGVAKLLYEWDDVYWEAPGVFKIDGQFYLLYSKQDGWNPVDNYYISATSMSGPWSKPHPLAPEGLYAYNTQNAYDITIHGSEGTVHLYYGDHWNAPALGASTYAFYPVTYNSYDRTLSLSYSPAYSLNVERGTWIQLFPEATVSANMFKLPTSSGRVKIPCSTCPGGSTLDLSASESFTFVLPSEIKSGNKVLQFKYAYDGEKQEWSRLEVSIAGRGVGSTLLESTRAKDKYLHASIQIKDVKAASEVRVVLRDGKPRNVEGRTLGGIFVTSVDIYEWDG